MSANTITGSASARRDARKKSRAWETWHRLTKNKGAMMGLFIIVALIIITIICSIVLDYNMDVSKMDMANRFAPPSLSHLFGTDDYGRDMLIRILYGTRYSLLLGIGAVAISTVVGVTLGSIAGYYGGLADDIIMRICDIMASIPSLLLGMCIMTIMGQSLPNLLIAVGLPGIPSFARIARSSVMSVKGQEYVEAAKSIGMSNARIIFGQVLPNGLSPILVTITTRIGSAINEGAALSFLGFGVPIPTPEWGSIISAGRSFITKAPWLSIIPGLFILITVLSFNLLGDGLRDALDPKMKR